MPSTECPLGLLGLTLGSPSREEEVEPFLRELFGDRDMVQLPLQGLLGPLITRLRAPKAIARYRRIGGASPLMAQSRAQVEGAARVLAARGLTVRPYLAARYLGPRVRDVLATMARDGVRRAVALPLYPQRSRVTTGSALADLRAALLEAAAPPEVLLPGPWCEHPAYVEALASTVEEALSTLPDDVRPEAYLLFSAHGIPQRLADAGDTYPGEVEATVRAVRRRLAWQGPGGLSYQSRVGPARWLGPHTGDVVRDLGRRGTRALVVVPVSFVSDHLETIHDLDIELAEVARSAGIVHYRRCPALNTRPAFLEALARVVEEAMGAGVSPWKDVARNQ